VRSPWQVRFVRWSGRTLHYGVETRNVQGVTIRITSPARTIVDCFRYRHKIGLDVALEALEDGLRDRKTTVSALTRAAEACRARTVIRPYLESLAR
jgi:predicted transcriptional regulator of viral defense system